MIYYITDGMVYQYVEAPERNQWFWSLLEGMFASSDVITINELGDL